jgi:uncharacterized YccA/Bax inhibitor family protein
VSNPLLNDKAFQSARAAADGPGWAAPNPTTRFGTPTVEQSNTMTMNGTMSATAVLFALLMLGGVVGWRAVTVREGVGAQFPTWSVLAILGALGMMLLTNFKPHLAKITGPIYAVLQGLLVGAITHAYDIQYNGIAIQAVGATTAVIGVIVLLQKTRIVKVTDRMRRIVLSATMGVFVFYMITFVLSFFGFKATFLSDGSPLAIFLSLALAGLAAFRFLVEIDFVEKQTQMGAPKEMEWFAAFGLLASTVWLYLEILRLLANLNRR